MLTEFLKFCRVILRYITFAAFEVLKGKCICNYSHYRVRISANVLRMVLILLFVLLNMLFHH